MSGALAGSYEAVGSWEHVRMCVGLSGPQFSSLQICRHELTSQASVSASTQQDKRSAAAEPTDLDAFFELGQLVADARVRRRREQQHDQSQGKNQRQRRPTPSPYYKRHVVNIQGMAGAGWEPAADKQLACSKLHLPSPTRSRGQRDVGYRRWPLLAAIGRRITVRCRSPQRGDPTELDPDHLKVTILPGVPTNSRSHLRLSYHESLRRCRCARVEQRTAASMPISEGGCSLDLRSAIRARQSITW